MCGLKVYVTGCGIRTRVTGMVGEVSTTTLRVVIDSYSYILSIWFYNVVEILMIGF